MDPRVIFRTHYQVDEPAYVALLVKGCTSPIQSAYDAYIAQRLTREVRAKDKDFNIAAAGYALDLGRGLGVLNAQNLWTDKGHLLNLVMHDRDGSWTNGLKLAFAERLLFFRLFLEADGAALLFLARYLVKNQRIPTATSDWNAVARDLFLQVFTDYLELSATISARVKLRNEIERIRKSGYTGKSGSHKLFIHLQTLYRIGLVDRVEDGAARVYELRHGSGAQLSTLVTEITSAYALEEVVREHRWAQVAARVFGVGDAIREIGRDQLLARLVPKYVTVASTGVSLCPLPTVVEAIQIDLLSSDSTLVTYGAIVQVLQDIQRESGADVRFHVDRRGAIAFVKLSDQLVADYGHY